MREGRKLGNFMGKKGKKVREKELRGCSFLLKRKKNDMGKIKKTNIYDTARKLNWKKRKWKRKKKREQWEEEKKR